MQLEGHEIVSLPKPKYNWVNPDALSARTPDTQIFGMVQGAAICVVAQTGLGKTSTVLSLPKTFSYFLIGEILYRNESKIIGCPPNIENINSGLSLSKGKLIIDSMSAVHPGDPRYGKIGFDLTQPEVMQELDILASTKGHIIFFTYNPFNKTVEDAALSEIAGRLRIYVVCLPGFKVQVMNPLTRKLSKSIPNDSVWDYMTRDFKKDSSPICRELYPL